MPNNWTTELIIENWENEAYYELNNANTNFMWGWEFLRRNPRYQKDWLLAYDAYKSEKRKVDKSLHPERWFEGYWDNPPEHPNFFVIIGIGSSIPEPWKKWGIHMYLNPATKRPFIVGNIKNGTLFRVYVGDNHPLKGKISDDRHSEFKLAYAPFPKQEFAISINPYNHIQPQLKELEKFLKNIQSKNNISIGRKTNHVQNWKIYLRVLDAANQSTRKHAAPIIFRKKHSPEESWDEYLKQAKILSKGGYRKLLLS